MEIKKINQKIIKEYIQDSDKDDIDLNIFLGLYVNYYNLNPTLEIKHEDYDYKNYEEEIYTINNEILSDIKRVWIEIDKIKTGIKTAKNPIIKKYIQKHIYLLQSLIQENPDNIKELMDYLKKQIVRIQMLLGMDITFYNAAHELFINEYLKLEENVNNKKVK